jgi:hypothetical protein
MRLRVELHEPEPDENQAKHVEKVGANQRQTPSQRVFMQVKPYMRLSFLPCFESFHPLGVE